ncbi:MAG: Asparagine synthetase [Candidatus Beckwithbacteria bacterium GW2011_GWB1_47_15]|uniref:asparagine synthase (glutamine-hydrolyzing) n=1 Tax=Candidatus Beckwithbacteria bacterium GW2011_GWB1_47_15 TaxID=1618371 RepID=A0A0G1UVJ0_9BACT|nr:MAG: exosortase 1 system-associated amidotransferase 1, asparagine synthase (glutamine-hydrolysing) [Candidatus Beckwithbacteria bacterium GW2011_GWC1_49_16]KKU35666.1 MAG: Asparagine synthetase [Candidatus Beckwithbacteria bacterium GW2011_GWA1_46_30]KKU61720.1 MAG: Asparagine synthetase [Candidatus Beckwithbacteria bacterium GW2011_GWB1_47_15]KKU72224.1 MAG: Asparagine synthetase [Candidatus Beckwithbacteria bacterium GW2011_GWA2_47_25]KKW05015.1 MAG: Asparagine synthetase [Candidatus Beck
MCGIAGIINLNGQPVEEKEIGLMCQAIAHRGPDDQGIWIKGPVGLGNRRLSIIDLSSAGNQPIHNEDKTVWITFNGEIYNFKDLRKNLVKKGHKFYSQTDTEAIVHLWEEYGPNCVKFLRGQFAFGLWDDKKKILFLARDRLGQKPLKYYLTDKEIIFASELKAILKVKGVKKELDPIAVDHFFSLEAVPAPLTGFVNIKKLPAASYLVVKKGQATIKRYWKFKFLPKHKLGLDELNQEVVRRLTEAVELRLVADVPVGAFLSGGVDSSSIVALMKKLGHKNLNTFSVGFEEKEFSELKYARMAAKKFGTSHHEILLRPDSFSWLEKLAYHYEEPYGDPSALPTYLVSKLAAKKLKVVLNGDGGDDIFAGYQRYQKFGAINLISRLLPNWSRRLAKNLMPPTLADLLSQPGFGEYAAAYLGLTSPVNFKKQLYSKEFYMRIDPLSGQKLILKQKLPGLTPLDNVLLADLNIYLSQVLLPKVDIASMAHGLEVRSPFLDHILVNFVNQIPSELKLRRGVGKYIFKKAVEGLVPDEIINRPKMGFGFPLGSWLRNQWQDGVKDVLLNEKALSRQYLNQEVVKQMIEKPLEGEHYDRRLWRVLMFELWLKSYFGRK